MSQLRSRWPRNRAVSPADGRVQYVASDLLVDVLRTLSRRLLAVAVVLVCGGCLLPPPIEPATEFDNQPPRIVPSGIFPDPASMPVLLSTQCTEPELFNLAVFDADEDDTIYWRVFVDFEANPLQFEEFPDLIDRVPVEPSSVGGDGRRQLRFELDATDERFSAGPNRFEVPHVVEVIASDGIFDDDPFRAREPDPSISGTETTLWAWTITLSDGPCPVGAN